MTTIVETYRLVPKEGAERELGLVEIETSLDGRGLIANELRLMLLAEGGLPEGAYRLQFVKKLAGDRIERRRFPQLATSNDRGGQR